MIRISKRNQTFIIKVTDSEVSMVKALGKLFGDIPNSDVIRRCIEKVYTKTFPLYLVKGTSAAENLSKLEEPELTPEQACEKFGGRVEKRASDKMTVCVQKIYGSGFTYSTPITMAQEIKRIFELNK